MRRWLSVRWIEGKKLVRLALYSAADRPAQAASNRWLDQALLRAMARKCSTSMGIGSLQSRRAWVPADHNTARRRRDSVGGVIQARGLSLYHRAGNMQRSAKPPVLRLPKGPERR